MGKKFSRITDVVCGAIGLTLDILAISGIIPIGVGCFGLMISVYHLIREIKKKN